MATSKLSATRRQSNSKDGVSGDRPASEPRRSRALWELRLYVAGMTPTSIRAFENLKKICEEHLQGLYSIQVIDLLERPLLARGDQIIAVPTLVRRLPTPVKKIIGDFSNTERVLVGLDLRPAGGWHCFIASTAGCSGRGPLQGRPTLRPDLQFRPLSREQAQ